MNDWPIHKIKSHMPPPPLLGERPFPVEPGGPYAAIITYSLKDQADIPEAECEAYVAGFNRGIEYSNLMYRANEAYKERSKSND